MSRIIVKNLPRKVSQEKLREFFSSKGEVTDVHLKFDQDGKFRQFAFIGFKKDAEASEAVESLNKTYMDSMKIIVEAYSDQSVPSRFAGNKRKDRIFDDQREEKLAYQSEKEKEVPAKKKKLDPFEELKDDPEFAEFLQVQRNLGDNKRPIWADDIVMDSEKAEIENKGADDAPDSGHEPSPPAKGKGAKTTRTKKNVKNIVPPKELFKLTVKLVGLPYQCKRSMLKEFFKPLKLLSIRQPQQFKGVAFVSFQSEADLKQGLIKHKSFIEGHQIEVKMHKKEDDSKNKSGTTVPAKKQTAKKDYKVPEENIADSGRMFVRNLAYTCTAEDLEELFSTYGDLAEVHLPIDRESKKPKGFAFVSFVFPEHAVKAYSELDKTAFQGRLLHLIAAEAKPEGQEKGLIEGPNSSFKKNRDTEKKADAMTAKNWNSLFLSADAVAEVMAERFNVKKSKLIADPGAKDSIAVRMALGETQLVNETRRFLIDNGIDLAVLDEKEPKRSKNVIIVKNLPAKTSSDEIQELFARFGSVNRIVLPPYGITAVVDMQEKNEAKAAFKKLALTNFKHVPLYLEWAPINLFKTPEASINSENEQEKKSSEENAVDGQQDKEDKISNGAQSGRSDKKSSSQELNDDAAAAADGRTLFVKSINFDTSDADFKSHFAKSGKLVSADISRRRDGSGLSMGYGFVVYAEASGAQKALKSVHNSTLDGHCLQVSLSRSSVKTDQAKSSSKRAVRPETRQKPSTSLRKEDEEAGGASSSKIVVRNVPFEATSSEVEELFRAFGELKSVRLPKKLAGTGTHRGFGFVEFVTKHDAERAYEALSGSTHLYGRRLVLEWAKSTQDDDQPM